MQNANKEEKKLPNTISDSEEIDFKTLFSEDEIRAITKAFIMAYMNQAVTIHFPSMEQIKKNVKFGDGEDISIKTAIEQEVKCKTEMLDLMSISAGRIGTTPKQQKEATYRLFQEILTYRLGNKLEGDFMKYAFEERLERTEEDIKALFDKFEDLYFYVRTHVSDDNVSPIKP